MVRCAISIGNVIFFFRSDDNDVLIFPVNQDCLTLVVTC